MGEALDTVRQPEAPARDLPCKSGGREGVLSVATCTGSRDAVLPKQRPASLNVVLTV